MRIKKSFSNYNELAHVWASQRQDEGHTPGNRMFFKGPSIYSYGYHFEIARFIKSQKGQVVLFTDRDYSNTTSKHKWATREAITHVKSFVVPEFNDHNANVDAYLDYIKTSLESAPRTFHINGVLGDIRETTKTAKSYLEYFGRSVSKERKAALRKYDKKQLIPADLLEKLQAREAKNAERQEKARQTREANRKIKEAKRRAEYAEAQRKREEKTRLDRENLPADIKRWQNGENVDNQFLYDAPIMLRITGNNIETSHHADVPLIEARKFWHKLQSRENVVGMRLGLYTVDALEGDILKVGCHNIPVREVLRMARVLNWANDEGAALEVLS